MMKPKTYCNRMLLLGSALVAGLREERGLAALARGRRVLHIEAIV